MRNAVRISPRMAITGPLPCVALQFATVQLATALGALLLGAPAACADEPARSLTFEADIRPIFRAHCFDCHGATDEKQGGLDLRLVRFQLTGGESGPALVPGQPGESHLLERIR